MACSVELSMKKSRGFHIGLTDRKDILFNINDE